MASAPVVLRQGHFFVRCHGWSLCRKVNSRFSIELILGLRILIRNKEGNLARVY